MKLKEFNVLLAQGTDVAGRELYFLLLFSILSPIAVLFFSGKVALLISMALFLSLVFVFLRVHIIQVFMLTLLLGGLFFQSNTYHFIIFYNVFFAFLIMYYFLYQCIKPELSDKISYHLEIAGFFLLLGFIAFLSMIVNARFTSRGILETIRYFSLCPLFLILYFFMKDKIMISKMLATVMFISIFFAFYSYWIVYNMGLKGFLIYGITSLHGVHTELGNANSLAMIIGYSLPVLLSYMMFGKNKMKKPYVFLGVLFLIIIWFLCNSRSSYVYLFFSIILLISFHKKRLRYFALILLSIILGAVFLSSLPILQDILRLESGLSLREELWKTAVEMIKDNPILGTGPGSYGEAKYYYMVPSKARNILGVTLGLSPHNLILAKASDLGIGAVVIILAFWFYVLYFLIKHEKDMRNSDYYYLYLASGAIFIGLIFRSIFEIGNMIGNARLNENILTLFFVALIFRLPTLIKDDK